MTRKWLLTLWIMVLFCVGCSSKPHNQVEGYVEGRYTYITTPVSGQLLELDATRGSFVKKGQILFILQAQPESDAYKAAIENLQQSIHARDTIAANLTYAKEIYDRYKLLAPKAIAQSLLDNVRASYRANLADLAKANAAIASSKANVAQTKWTKDQKIIEAPVDALIFDTYYRIGEYTVANQSILSLLAPSDIKAIFYINGLNLRKLKLRDPISVQCAGCKSEIKAYITFISPSAEYTPPIIYSNETNDKLIYRIEAEFSKDDAYNLHPGEPVTVTYFPHDR